MLVAGLQRTGTRQTTLVHPANHKDDIAAPTRDYSLSVATDERGGAGACEIEL